MNIKLQQSIIDNAQEYITMGEELQSWIDNIGWADWMLELCRDDSSLEDGAELTEPDIKRINAFLQECWDKAEDNINNNQ